MPFFKNRQHEVMHENGAMRPAESIPGMEGGKIKENDGGVNSAMI
jgi:hypothetical protein